MLIDATTPTLLDALVRWSRRETNRLGPGHRHAMYLQSTLASTGISWSTFQLRKWLLAIRQFNGTWVRDYETVLIGGQCSFAENFRQYQKEQGWTALNGATPWSFHHERQPSNTYLMFAVDETGNRWASSTRIGLSLG